MEIFWTKVKDIIKETTEINTYILECPEEFTWEAGAHTHFALEGFNIGEKPNRSLVRHMSISTLPEEEVIGITTRVKEECSEFKSILRSEGIGKKVALFKTSTNMPLKREHRPIYLLSSGVGIATFRPLLLDYLKDDSGVASIHSLNVDSTGDFLFGDIFQSDKAKGISVESVTSRKAYYDALSLLVLDKTAFFYIVGSDEFLTENISVLQKAGIWNERIVLDKHDFQLEKFLK
ncbi:dihydropteridine reductase [Vagococcus fluvialis]|uniref:dihydropteridine reductase n=2 Tax=Vagococcus fluvialis TaxID=2738 RepID=UPI003B593BC7